MRHFLKQARDDATMAVPGADLTPGVAICHYICVVAHFHAIRQGLSLDDADDCAMDFVTRMLQGDKYSRDHHENGAYWEAWLHRCAKNHVHNFRRHLTTNRQHECLWSEMTGAQEASLMGDIPDRQAGPESRLIQKEFWGQVTEAVERLEPAQQMYVYRHYVLGESIEELAEACGKTQNAVRQAMLRARAHLRSLFLRQGVTEADLYSYLVHLTGERSPQGGSEPPGNSHRKRPRP